MENISFKFRGIIIEFSREQLDRWMSSPLPKNKKINLLDPDQAEAAFDMVCDQDMSTKDISLLEQMGKKEFAKLFTVSEEVQSWE
jgi:hypothetical protein